MRWTLVAAALLTATLSVAARDAGEPPPDVAIDNSRLIYSVEEMLGFDLEDYLAAEMPDLLPYRETISHWSGYTTISPKVALTLIALGELGPGELGSAEDFSTRLHDALAALAAFFYDYRRPSRTADPLAGLPGYRDPEAATVALGAFLDAPADLRAFGDVYAALFPDELTLSVPRPSARFATKAPAPPASFMQLPYGVGRSWIFSGSHSFTGQNQGPKSSIDFARNWPPWGANTGGDWVVAANPGTVVVHSSCFVEVLGTGGWSTSYYHLDNVIVADGQRVSRDQRLSNYADNEAQALCNGGHSTGPHVHFSLRRNGQHASLEGALLSGFTVHTAPLDYESSCALFWLERDGIRHCAWVPLRNPGVSAPPPPPARPDGLTASVVSSTEIALGWNDNSGDETEFLLERRRGGGPFRDLATVGAGVVEYLDAGLVPGTSYSYRVRARGNSGTSSYSNVASATTPSGTPEPCVAGPETMCLNGGRFRVELMWRDFENRTGTGKAVDAGIDDSGILWFFDPANWEMLVKVLDGCGINGRYWVFSAATTTVEYTLRVTDSQTGAVRVYENRLGTPAATVTDTDAFATCP